MSTKNLARTVIEGGRWPGATRMCRHENRALRATTRSVLAGIIPSDADADADEWTVARPPKIGRHFRDKLSAPERWLDQQVGRPWDLIRRELLERFDPRTTAGRHIVFDHMLPWVHRAGIDCSWSLFSVDAHGLLRRTRRRVRRVTSHLAPLPRPERALRTWLSGRRVGARGDVLFWFVPTVHGGYRQHHRLGADDVALWRSLPDWFRACHDPSATPPANASRAS